jgi:hypothetical protein
MNPTSGRRSSDAYSHFSSGVIEAADDCVAPGARLFSNRAYTVAKLETAINEQTMTPSTAGYHNTHACANRFAPTFRVHMFFGTSS